MVEDVARIRPMRALRAVLSAVVLVGAFELIVRQPGSFWAVFGTVMGFVLLVVLSHGSRSWKHKEDRSVMMLSLMLTASSMLFLLFPVGLVVQHVVAVGLALAISVLLFVFRRPVVTESGGANVVLPEAFVYLTAFLGFSVIFSASLFFQSWPSVWNVLAVLLTVGVLAVVCAWQLYVYQLVSARRALVYSVVCSMLMMQIAWALTFWPTDGFSRAGVLFVCFYSVMGLAKHALKQRFTWRVLGEYVVTSAVVTTLVLSTTQWIY